MERAEITTRDGFDKISGMTCTMRHRRCDCETTEAISKMLRISFSFIAATYAFSRAVRELLNAFCSRVMGPAKIFGSSKKGHL